MTTNEALRELSRILLTAALVFGCAGNEGARPPAQKGHAQGALLTDAGSDAAVNDAVGEVSVEEAPVGGAEPKRVCAELTQRTCVVELRQASGVRSCWKGVQFCVDGAWSECLEADDASTSPN